MRFFAARKYGSFCSSMTPCEPGWQPAKARQISRSESRKKDMARKLNERSGRRNETLPTKGSQRVNLHAERNGFCSVVLPGLCAVGVENGFFPAPAFGIFGRKNGLVTT